MRCICRRRGDKIENCQNWCFRERTMSASVGEIEGAHLAGSGGRVARTAFPRELKRTGTFLGERTSDPDVRALAVPEGMPP